jgi:gluconolactonase
VLFGRIGAAVGAAALAPRMANAQGAPVPPPPAYDTHRDYNPASDPVSYPDPDIVTIDPAFNALRVNNTAIHRLWTGGMWSEGPAWCSQGKYLVWSDVPMSSAAGSTTAASRCSAIRRTTATATRSTSGRRSRASTLTPHRQYEHDGSITAVAESSG